ncbi:MAG: isoleucine--tRNA ligase [Ruminococcaceae bacterium]|jgi:isoleucyl-tRNA synthetase|nr:isoleucine--tRNA ligase [Oscillospiraceae bacterium]
MDYGKTLNLPQTEFSMRANLPQKEPAILDDWNKQDLYHKVLKHNAGKPSFNLHDGPPYANGDIHLGHTMNKVIKDIIVRYKNMSGYCAPYVPGWDTHGLPIEKQAIKKLGVNRHEVGPVKFREVCRDFALGYVNNQKEQFKRLGVIGDFDDPYVTLKPEFEAKQIEMFGTMAKKGYIYKGLKPVYWCADCETALAEAEIEYQDDKTKSIYVKFEVTDDKGLFADIYKKVKKVYYVIWTTTTWTMPANLAICLNADFDYSIVKNGDEAYVVATGLLENVMNVGGIADYEVIGEFKGSDLEYMVCRHPFIERDSLVIVGDHVTLESGTGCVHTAPGHGTEDFIVCQKYKDKIGIVVPVDAKGYMTADAGEFEGLSYKEANVAIFNKLESTGALFASEDILHSYPHCWRCKEPIVYRATEQWFASVDGFKDEALKAIKDVKWIPSWGEDRITGMVRDRNDWCISRQRIWGVPIPIFYCKDCGKELINDDTIKVISDLFREKGSDAWFAMTPAEMLAGHDFKCPDCGCGEFTKETDIMDVWFDSGSSHAAVLQTRPELSWPADLYLEGNDQYRGWFQSSLLVSVANFGTAPYKSVLTHGMVIDLEGNKMSKSKGNGIDPLDVINKNGADILRMWVASADYTSDVKISNDLIRQLSEGYRKIRNTARYILGNISDFDPKKDMISCDNMEEIDKWAMLRLNALAKKVRDAYDSYDFHIVYHSIVNFCVVDMSNFYLDIIKDRLYTEKADSAMRRSAQSAMYIILSNIVRFISPILAYTSEEIWKAMPHLDGENTESVLLNDMPSYDETFTDSALKEKYDTLIALRSDVAKALELARAEKIIGSSLGAGVTIYAQGKTFDEINALKDLLETVFIVSSVNLVNGEGEGVKGENKDITVKVEEAKGEKCERCWLIRDLGTDPKHPTLCPRCASVMRSVNFE